MIFAILTALIACGNGAGADSAEEEYATITMQYDDRLSVKGKTVKIIKSGTPTSYSVGYYADENMHDYSVITYEEDLIIASGIGVAYLSIDGVDYRVTVEPAPISLIMLAGQSNMRGSEGDASQSIACENGKVYSTYAEPHKMSAANATNYVPSSLTGANADINVNGNTMGISEYAINSLTEDGNGKFGPDSGFAYQWNKQTGEKIWLVNVAHGGSSILTWQPGRDNYQEALLMFSACQETLRREIAAGHYTLSHMGYFWCQGESDATKTAEYYVESFLIMHNAFKRDFAFDHDANLQTEPKILEFAGIIPCRTSTQKSTHYRQGEYNDQAEGNYFESFLDIAFSGPRVAQYWLGNNPELKDIHVVCNVGDSWVTMPDGSDGVAAYFEDNYNFGKVNYKTQTPQNPNWYSPVTPAAVHDSVHYNQIGYNEIGLQSALTMLYILGEVKPPEVQTTVNFFAWDGYTEITSINAITQGCSNSLVVPVVYPLWNAKQVTYTVSEGLSYSYYDLLAQTNKTQGILQASISGKAVTVNG